MSIEEIKGKLHNYELFYAGDSEEAFKDITYLLSIIEKCLAYEKHASCNFCGGGIERICNNLDPIE